MTPTPDDIRKAREIEFLGFKIEENPHLPPNYMLWIGKNEVLGIAKLNSDRDKLLNKFGLISAAPEGTTGAVLSPEDYETVEMAIRRSEP